MATRNLFGDLSLEATQLAILTKLSDLASGAGLTTLAGKLDTLITGQSALQDTFHTSPAGLKVDGSATTQPVSGSVAVTNLPTTQHVAGEVSVTNLPETQPVSLADNSPDVTDRPTRLLGHVTVDNASLPVEGDFYPANQPVSVDALPLPAGAATEQMLTETVAASEEVVALLQAILSRLGYPDMGSAANRVYVAGWLSNVAVGNVTQHGGLNAIYDQHAAMLAGAAVIRNQITTS